MKLLALDTATEACSAALYIDGDIQQRYQLAPREHTQLILGMANELLAEAELAVSDLTALAFGRGPGSFTGVRIATGVVQGMAYAADLPVVPVSTLASIAQAAYEDHQAEHILAAIDARMGGVYWGQYEAVEGLVSLVGEEMVTTPLEVPVPNVLGVGAGSGWKGHGEALKARVSDKVDQAFDDYFPQSKTIARLAVADFDKGLAVDAAQAIPIYLRDDVAKKAKSAT